MCGWGGGPQGQHCDSVTEALMCLKFRVMIRELRSHKVLRGKMFQSKLSQQRACWKGNFQIKRKQNLSLKWI